MTNSQVLKAINKQSILGFKKAETVVEKIKEAIKTPFRHNQTSNGRLIDIQFKTDNGRIRLLLSNHSINGNFYISQMEAKDDTNRKNRG